MLLNPPRFVNVNEDGRLFWRNDKEQRLILKPKKIITYSAEGKPVKKEFYDVWIEDENIRKYKEIVFDPSSKSNSYNYNLFTGFKYDSDLIETELNPVFSKMFNHIFNGDTTLIYNWISHIINKPDEKSGIAIVLYSQTHGVGKNTIIELLMKFFERYTGKLETIEDLTERFNDSICNKLFIYGDEIKPKAKELSDELKNIIVRSEVNWEVKNYNKQKIKDYSNYIFTTNNELAFNLESTDRRYYMVSCPDFKLDSIYYETFYKLLKDENEIKKAFSYFKNYKRIELKKIDLSTDYKKNIISQRLPAYIKMLFRDTLKLANRKIAPMDLYDMSLSYAKNNYGSTAYTLTEFGREIGKIIPTVKTNGYKKYKFGTLDELKQLLKTYNESAYTYLGTCDLFEDDSSETENALDV
jgi:hypothetical protein